MYMSPSTKLVRSIYFAFISALSIGLIACGGGSSSSSTSGGAPTSNGPSTYYVVSTLSDSGAGSLRTAITSVNSAPSTQYSGIKLLTLLYNSRLV